VNKRVAPSIELEAAIERLLAEGLTDSERLAEIGRLRARLVLQRAIEEEVDAFLGRTRYERKPEALGWRNGNRPKRVQTAEGELEIQVPQIRGAVEKFVSSVIPNGRTALRTRPLEALIIGAWVRGCRTATSRAWSRRPAWGSSRKPRCARSPRSYERATGPSGRGAWAMSSCWCCSWMRSTCRPGRAAPRRACWWPGATTRPGIGCCWTSCSGSGSASRTGWRWAVAWSDAACGRRCWLSPTGRQG